MKDRIALVTGAASGIGAATAALLRARGATVVATDIAEGDGIAPLDVTDEEAVDGLVARILEEHGRLDLAANVAGVPGSYAETADSTTEVWRRTMAVNLDGVYFCLRAELRAGASSIVNVASVGRAHGRPRPRRLLRQQARRHRAHEERGPRGRPPRRPRQLRVPRLRAHADAQRLRRWRRSRPRIDGPAGADGSAG